MSERDGARPDGADEASDLAAGYALGSLSAEEQARYERLVESSEHAARERVQFGTVAAALNGAPPVAQPSPDLKARLMAQIAVTPQQAPAAATGTDARVEPSAEPRDEPVPEPGAEPSQEPSRGPGHEPVAEPAPPVLGSAERRAQARWYRRPVAIVAAAAVAAAIFAGGAAVGFTASQHSVVSAQADSLAQITSAPDVQRTTSSVSGGGTATLVWSASLGKSAMIVDGVAPAPKGRTYQLWYIRGGAAISAGLMSGQWQVLKGYFQKGDTVGLTVEPHGGSKQPTTKPVVAIVS